MYDELAQEGEEEINKLTNFAQHVDKKSVEKKKRKMTKTELRELNTIGFTDVSDLEEEALTLDPEEFKRQKLMEQKKKEAELKAAEEKKKKEEEEKKKAEEQKKIKENNLIQQESENQTVSKEEQLEETFEAEMM